VALAEALRRIGGDVVTQGDELHVTDLDVAAVGDAAFREGLVLHELSLVRSSLEDAFMSLTADSVEYRAKEGAAA
jgi:ABC-2 type transport system ATP-binding protein